MPAGREPPSFPGNVERRFPRDLASLESIYAFLRTFLREHGIDDRHAWDLDVVAEELFTNLIKYGRGREAIALGLEWAAPILTLRLRDFDADDFDPNRAPEVDPTTPILQRRAGGLGIHLVRRIADRIDYRRDHRTNTITVTKRISS